MLRTSSFSELAICLWIACIFYDLVFAIDDSPHYVNNLFLLISTALLWYKCKKTLPLYQYLLFWLSRLISLYCNSSVCHHMWSFSTTGLSSLRCSLRSALCCAWPFGWHVPVPFCRASLGCLSIYISAALSSVSITGLSQVIFSCWADPSWYPPSCSITPTLSGMGARNRGQMWEKLVGQDKQLNKWREKHQGKHEFMQTESLIASHQEFDAQLFSQQGLHWKNSLPQFYCWTWLFMVCDMFLVGLGQLCALPASCPHLNSPVMQVRVRSREDLDIVQALFSNG